MTTHVLTAHELTFFKPTHPAIQVITEELGEANLHGNKVWDASFVLMDFLQLIDFPRNKQVLDIGCGWGPLTCYLKKAHSANVISVDADRSVEPFLKFQSTFNGLRSHFLQAKISQLRVDDLSVADVLMGGDICFWDSLRDDWKKLFKRAKKAGVQTIYLADPGRSPFHELVDWAADKFDVELWEHDIKKPVKSSHYILEVNF